ncbi:MAG: UDP-N-acetylglucosamine--N-acetylmuramyl-(pentapeptide) pyrophosphoryl-undecaprenol [Homoserinimonas sp.]|nr:UDP-N-acetylglucosamine--N-acetylmuramyl-(pentapeptide) pyrophosphoryl-undecaprenol [Homoserinimonas sp.]
MTRYLLAGGGTAGHVNPLLAVADYLRDNEPEAEIMALGTAQGLEARLVPERGYELLVVDRLPFPRRIGGPAVRFPENFRKVVSTVEGFISSRNIDVVVGFGGYVSAPAYIAARRAGIPFVIHEANARPGLANRLGSRFTPFVGVTFPGTKLPHARVVGMPLRREIESLDRRVRRKQAREFFGLDPTRMTLLVTGGSLGAARINETIAASAAEIVGAGWQILHITGEGSGLADSELDAHHMIRYCDRMELAFSAADLAVARAGSVTVSEVTAIGLPAVYVPLAIGNGEQKLNARGVVQAGGARLVNNADFTPQWVRSQLVPLLQDRAAIAGMAARAAAFGVRNGTEQTAALIRDALRGSSPSSSEVN